MNYKVVFDLNNNRFSYLYFIPFPFLFISLSSYICAVEYNMFSPSAKTSLAFLIFSFFLWSLLMATQMLADYRYIIKPYKKNACDVVEGCVSNFTPRQRKNGTESFDVSGLKFSYPNASSKIGYRTFCNKGGAITKNGQNVRVTYAYDDMLGKDNIIVKLEIEE